SGSRPSPPAPPGHGDEARDGPGAALAWGASGLTAPAASTAVLVLGDACDFANELAALPVVLTDRVLSDVDEPLAVYVHAVSLWRVERADPLAGLGGLDI